MPPALAYEDGVRPDASTYRPTPKARFLPAPLIRARAEVFDPRNCLDLNRVARHALFGILAFFDVRRPAEPVFASRESICAESLLGSQPTLYRGLAHLVTCGYIRREQSRRLSRQAYGQYAVSRIWLEEKALRLLGLLDPEPKQGRARVSARLERAASYSGKSPGYSQGPSLTARGRLQEEELSPNTQHSSNEQPPEASAGEPQANSAGGSLPRFPIDRRTGLPEDLARLLSRGLSKSRVCALMRIARESGNGGMLGTVVDLVWHSLERLHGDAVFAYLAKLVRQRKDYPRMLQIRDSHEDGREMGPAHAARLNEKVPMFLDRYAGFELITREGMVLGVIRRLGTNGLVEGIDERGTWRSTPVNARLIERWEEGVFRVRSLSADSVSAAERPT